MDSATIIVNHGSSNKAQYELLKSVLEKLKKDFPESYISTYLASSKIRKKIEDEDLKKELNDILDDLRVKNIRKVKFLMLYVVRGIEYEKLEKLANSLNTDDFFEFSFTKALLEENSYNNEILNLIDYISQNDYSLIVAHGSPRKDLDQFNRFSKQIKNHSNKFYFSTFEDDDMDMIIKELKDKNVKKIKIIPFLILAGNHVHKDIESERDNSYKTILNKNKIEVEVINKGLIAYDKILDIFIKKLA